MKRNKETHYLLTIIFITVLLILIMYFYSINMIGTGILKFWIKNYNPSCTSNNISQCDSQTIKIIRISVDNRMIGGPITLTGGMLWQTNLTLTSGNHQIKITTKTDIITIQNLKIEKDKTRCYQLPWENSGTVIDVKSCPP
jgi:hypothetical protein